MVCGFILNRSVRAVLLIQVSTKSKDMVEMCGLGGKKNQILFMFQGKMKTSACLKEAENT